MNVDVREKLIVGDSEKLTLTFYNLQTYHRAVDLLQWNNKISPILIERFEKE